MGNAAKDLGKEQDQKEHGASVRPVYHSLTWADLGCRAACFTFSVLILMLVAAIATLSCRRQRPAALPPQAAAAEPVCSEASRSQRPLAATPLAAKPPSARHRTESPSPQPTTEAAG